MPRDTIEDSEAFICEVCWHYYVNQMTQAEVATALGVTRLRINKAIRKGRSLGIVRIEIRSPTLPRIELQQAVCEKLGIKRALVALARRDSYDYHNPAGTTLASYLVDCLRAHDWKRIGVSWGMTLENAIRSLPQLSQPGLEVVSMLGGTSHGATFNTFGIASGFARCFGATYSILAAPTFLSKGVDRSLFLSQEIFTAHFEKFQTMDAAIVTASDVSSRSFLVANGLPEDVTREELVEAGAVGDVLGRFLDKDGHDVDHSLDQRTIGVSIAALERVPEKIMAAAGPHKSLIIQAAAKRGLIDTLVTDDVTAELILADDA